MEENYERGILVEDGENQFKTLANAIPNLAWIAEADGYIFWYNERWYEYTGTTPEQMKGWGWQSVHDPTLLPGVMERWVTSIKTGEPFEMVFPLRGVNGVFRSFLTRVVPLKDAQGKVSRWFGTNTDVDELRRTQEALRQSEASLRLSQERLRLVQRVAKIAAWELDLDSDEYVWSEEVLEMFKRTNLGRGQADFLSLMNYATDRENARRALRLAGTKKKEYEIEFRLVWPDGQTRVIAARGRFFFNQGQNLILGVFIDITEAERYRALDFATKRPRVQKL
ncbi:MAG: hypothetical protein NVS1B11_34980 [Terriglobales bacterium]